MSVANPPFPNEYTLRTVAEVSSKPCFICHKPTTKVLTTVGNKVGVYLFLWSLLVYAGVVGAVGLLYAGLRRGLRRVGGGWFEWD